jgi:hypothetical protein
VADTGCIETWRQFLLFAYSCLGVSACSEKKHCSSLATKVNKLLSDYLSDRSVGFTTQLSTLYRKKKTVVIDYGVQNLTARVAAKIEEGAVRCAVRLTACNDALAAYDDDTAPFLTNHLNVRSVASACEQRSSSEIIGERCCGCQVVLGRHYWWTGWSPTPAS